MATAEGDLVWMPGTERRAGSRMTDFQTWLRGRTGETFATYDELWRWSVDDLEGFWAAAWDYFEILASRGYDQVLSSRELLDARWFPGARLNFAEQLLRHDDDRPAIIGIAEDGTRSERSWSQLRTEVAAVAATLRELGVQPGDRVVGYVPNVPEATVAFLATVSLGAVWSSCSPDFGTPSVVDRFQQIEPTVLFATDGYRYNGKRFDRTAVLEELRASLPTLQHTVLIPTLGDAQPPADTLPWSHCLRTDAELIFEQVPADHPLWVLYSSGTTGIPKAIVHGHGGITAMLNVSLGLHFDIGADDTFFWFTTTGWVMWNLVVSSLMLGATAVQYDGAPGYPHTGRLFEIAAETGATFAGTSAAYLTACAKADLRPGRDHDLSALRSVGFTGSPLAPQLYDWVHRTIDPELWFVSVSGGTDVCGAFVGGNPQLPVHAGELQCRCLGVDVQAFDDDGVPLVGEVGELVVTAPLPSMPIYLWGDEDGSRYRDSYFDVYPGVWRHGDWIKITPRGSAVIYGRSDSTINRQGVRMGSAEIYRVVEDLPEIVDSLVIDLTYGDRPAALPLFVVLADGAQLDDDLRGRIRARVRTEASPRHVPDPIIEVADVPRTLSNKKLEVPVRKILLGMDPEGVVNRDATANPAALDTFLELATTRFAAEDAAT